MTKTEALFFQLAVEPISKLHLEYSKDSKDNKAHSFSIPFIFSVIGKQCCIPIANDFTIRDLVFNIMAIL